MEAKYREEKEKPVEQMNHPSENPAVEYDQRQITYYKGLEGVRKKPHMYIIDTGIAGLHQLVFELVDNSIDEAMAGSCSTVTIILQDNGYVRVEDDGRGIPVDMHAEEKISSLELVLTHLHAGGKMEDKSAYKISGGTHGVGLSVVNALSSHMKVYSFRNGKTYFQEYRKGLKQADVKELDEQAATRGFHVEFKPDETIFETTDFSFDHLASRLRELAYLNRGVTIIFKDLRQLQDTGKERTETYHFEGGISEFVRKFNEHKKAINKKPVYYVKTGNIPGQEDVEVEFAVQYNNQYEETVFCYANNIRNPEGGTHLAGFRTALTRVMNDFIKRLEMDKRFKHTLTGDDVREGLVAVISVKLPQPQFHSQAKTKLVNTDIKGLVDNVVKEGFNRYFDEHPTVIEEILKKSVAAFEAREAARKAREKARGRKTALDNGSLPGKLADCTDTNPENCEIYLVEGDSAGGSAAQGRDRQFQAILPLWGKMLNVEKVRVAREERIFDNEKLQPIIASLGTGIGPDLDLKKLRYHKVIIMADADVDGSHIRTLLLVFFFRYFRKVLEAGHVYIACPPLFRVQKGKTERYVYNEEELEKVMKEMGSERLNIQRYKGLGEMNPDQLWETTMNPETRKIIQIQMEDIVEADRMFDVLLGEEVKPRREFIESHAAFVKNIDV